MPRKKKKAKKALGVEQLRFDIESGPDSLAQLGAAVGIGETSLALKIDSTLGEKIWSGANFETRTGYLTNQITQDVITDVERSLMAQEPYEDFIERMFKNMGIANTSDSQPSARMRDIENQLRAEGKVVWNEAMVSANVDDDSVLVWRSVLEATTTPGCAARHGKLIEEELGGETPGLHWGCYSSDTRVLTQRGFVYFKDVLPDDLFLSIAPGTGMIEWAKATKQIAYQYRGQMISVKSQSLDLLVTPNHQMVYVSAWDKEQGRSRIRFKRADALSAKDSIPCGGKWVGRSPSHIEIAGKRYPTADFMEFFGWFIAEGNVAARQNPRHKYLQICIAQTREDNRIRIAELCHRLFGGTKSTGKTSVYICREKGLAQWLQQFGKSWQKYIPQELKELSPQFLRCFLDAMIAGDGVAYDTKTINAAKGAVWDANFRPFQIHYTSSDRLASDLCELILKCGKSPVLYKHHMKQAGKMHKFANGNYPINHPCLGIGERWALWRSGVPSHVDYDDMVYCVELEKNHTLFVERNGKTAWCGNCKCDLFTMPNPNSEDPNVAAEGQAILDDMAEERAAWGATDDDLMEESEKPSRMFQFMRFKEAEPEDGYWVTRSLPRGGVLYSDLSINHYTCESQKPSRFLAFRGIACVN